MKKFFVIIAFASTIASCGPETKWVAGNQHLQRQREMVRQSKAQKNNLTHSTGSANATAH